MSAIVWQFDNSLALEWKLAFSGPVATAEFSKFAGLLSAAYWALIRYMTHKYFSLLM